MSGKKNSTSFVHRKRRNSLLVYEFLLRAISRALVENDTKKSSTVLSIMKKHYRPGTELYKELRLSNSLMKTTTRSDSVASSVMTEAKSGVRALNKEQLEKEKTYLIDDINKRLNDETFYDQPITRYKTYATIGTLFNAWSRPQISDLAHVAQYEESLIEWLKQDKNVEEQSSVSHESPGVNRLVFKIMTKKLNEKYSSLLDDDQKDLVREFALYGITGSDASIKGRLGGIKTKLLEAIDRSYSTLDQHVSSKLNEVQMKLNEEQIEEIDNAVISKYMTYAKLAKELLSEEESEQ